MANNENNAFVVWLIIILLIVGMAMVWYKYGRNREISIVEKIKNMFVREKPELPLWNIVLKPKIRGDLNYIIDYNNTIISQGVLRDNVPEIIRNVTANYTYTIKTWSDSDYYFTETKCKVITNVTECDLVLMEKANVSLVPSINSLVVNVNNGTLRSSTLCVGWMFPITRIRFNQLAETGIPTKYAHLADQCWNLGTITETVDLGFVFDGQLSNTKLNYYVTDFTNNYDNGLPDMSASFSYN